MVSQGELFEMDAVSLGVSLVVALCEPEIGVFEGRPGDFEVAELECVRSGPFGEQCELGEWSIGVECNRAIALVACERLAE